ncbi:Ankyrin repeat-containing domain [Plasmopara halstedii]|uniref:Ankyrin repeat-containing domain n=1 Tax=Plasmopara halstedii TaxID=4781 RepID=A0A0P1AL89_PLAHL|nr:Ankyrin repeat-containing domain [Plasmopara halstedii]CEG41382.1 Ankyrin repeat-containing domain [Plasmopara halstedii]|eukprot:XP_024577751.1 Ankyrin repeat-containing domain [Plasmopara halstedii]
MTSYSKRHKAIDVNEATTIHVFPVLTAVNLVCHECFRTKATESLLRMIDAFLDTFSQNLTLSTAYKKSNGSLRLLQYLAAREVKTMDPYLRRWEVNSVTGEMGARGDLQGLQWVIQEYLPGEFLTEVVAQAFANGHVNIVTFLWKEHRDIVYWGGIELVGAIRNHHDNLIAWLREKVELRFEYAQHVVKHAAAHGNVDVVRWLYEEFSVGIADALSSAASYCQWEVMRWLILILLFIRQIFFI